MTLDPRRLDDRVTVAPQIDPADVAAIAAAGFRVLVCNRPDGEGPGQPAFAEIDTLARAAGMETSYLPFRGGPDVDQVAAMAELIETAEGPIFAYCRSGTRCSILWAAARSSLGDPIDEIVAGAARGGYDLAPHADPIVMLGRAAASAR